MNGRAWLGTGEAGVDAGHVARYQFTAHLFLPIQQSYQRHQEAVHEHHRDSGTCEETFQGSSNW